MGMEPKVGVEPEWGMEPEMGDRSPGEERATVLIQNGDRGKGEEEGEAAEEEARTERKGRRRAEGGGCTLKSWAHALYKPTHYFMMLLSPRWCRACGAVRAVPCVRCRACGAVRAVPCGWCLTMW
jgi:hypothetical protein